VAAVVAGFLFIVTAVVIVPLLKRRINKRIEDERNAEAAKAAGHELEEAGYSASDEKHTSAAPAADDDKPVSFTQKVSTWVTHGLNVDIHKVVEEDPMVAELHNRAEKFDPHVEYVFAYLQVLLLRLLE
jgi:sodium-dependent phosphate transporter